MVAQFALGALIVSAGIAGPEWSNAARTTLLVGGIGICIAGLAMFITGVVALGSSLTPFPKPSEHSTLRSGGAYRLVRHPIYGGVLLLALGWSVVEPPKLKRLIRAAEGARRDLEVARSVLEVRCEMSAFVRSMPALSCPLGFS